MQKLSDPVRSLKGIGAKRAEAFARLGVLTLYDLLCYFPRRYEDRGSVTPIALTENGQTVCLSAVVAEEPRLSRIRRGMELVKVKVVDESGMAEITYFNQNWMKNNLIRGQEVFFYGKIEVSGTRRHMNNPVTEHADAERRVTGKIIPVYRSCQGLTQKNLLQSIRLAVDACASMLPEWIPEEILARHDLADVGFAYEQVHFPSDFASLSKARERLVYEELFSLACAMRTRRQNAAVQSGHVFSSPDMEAFYASLPYSPTGAQKRAVSDALADMRSGKPMNRLLQGDVGSGKTLCAAALAWAAWKNSAVTALMAPTEILAQQHYVSLCALLAPLGMRLAVLKGSMCAKEKAEVRAALGAREIDLIIGTHALFSEDVDYPGLGLVITDEQHRFGVGQRASLIRKGDAPHVLVMSATPIPRTLALLLYGDLDVSILDEMPPGRQNVDTFFVNSRYRARLNAFLRKQAENGNQSYVICPMVEDDDGEDSTLSLSLRSAEKQAEELRQALPELAVGCVHGRMKSEEKDAVMLRFAHGELDILVATTVVEVGVNVPNATLMIVENAERFGLSQLHQLRGRVGRGKDKSYCVLVSDAENEEAKARLNILCKTNDGFRIAEEDLRMRGPGDFFGSRQHGLPPMHAADLWADMDTLQTAREDADALFAKDPSLSLPEHLALRQKIEETLLSSSSTMN